MSYYALCLVVFIATYGLNIFYITVLYHRGLAHGAVELSPWLRTFTIKTGSWVTGIDPKGWACMHRLHHRHSDTERDPHSPWNHGVLGVMLGQLHSYERALKGVSHGPNEYSAIVTDLNFPVNALNRKKIWWLPYAIHAAISLVLGLVFHAWWLAAAYYFGMLSHPIQGWMVNSFAHKFGYRNFETSDRSRNNTLVAWLVAGEGYQNNHHARPASAKFSSRWFEFDGGYLMCRLAQAAGALRINRREIVS